MNIKDIAERAHNHAKKAGFLDNRNIDSMLMDIVDEVSEARKAENKKANWDDYEGFIEGNTGACKIKGWKGKITKQSFTCYIKNTLPDELIDLILIPLVIARHYNIDIERHLEAKMKYNELREDHNGKNS